MNKPRQRDQDPRYTADRSLCVDITGSLVESWAHARAPRCLEDASGGAACMTESGFLEVGVRSDVAQTAIRWLRRLFSTERRALITIVLSAVGLRVAASLFLGNEIESLPGIHDQISYDGLALQVLSGHGFTVPEAWWPATRAGEPTAHWSYLYTLYLTGVYSLFGHQPLVARLIQAMLGGILQPWLTWRVGRRVFGSRVGVVAAALSGIYAYFVYYAGALMTETFFFLAILWTLDLATAMAVSPPETGPGVRRGWLWWGRWLLLGFALGLAALLRQTVLLLTPFLFAWLSRSSRTVPGKIGRRSSWGILVSLAIMAVMILPWTVRNYRSFDRAVLLNTNAGYAFFWGNHPIHGTEFVPILPHDGPSYADLIPRDLRELDEAALDHALLVEGFRFVLDEPTRYALLSVSRAREYFKFWWSEDSGRLSNFARVASFGVSLPFMILGLGLSTFGWRAERDPRGSVAAPRPAGLGLLLGFVVSYSLIHLLSWALVRYRLPVDTVLVVFAAVGLVGASDLVARFRSGPDDPRQSEQASQEEPAESAGAKPL